MGIRSMAEIDFNYDNWFCFSIIVELSNNKSIEQMVSYNICFGHFCLILIKNYYSQLKLSPALRIKILFMSHKT